MKNLDRGIQTVEIPVTPRVFQRLYRKDIEYEMKRLLSRQYTGKPKFDPDDILEIFDWREASRDLQREGFGAVAVLRVARGGRLLAEWWQEHVFSPCQWLQGQPGSGGHVLDVEDDLVKLRCDCGERLVLDRESLIGLHLDPDPIPDREETYDVREV